MAAKLTGFKIDIKPASNPGGDEEGNEETEDRREELSQENGAPEEE